MYPNIMPDIMILAQGVLQRFVDKTALQNAKVGAGR